MNASKTERKAWSELTILITGAGFDIGRALSIACAKNGAHVILMDRDNRALNAVYDEITAAEYCEPTILNIDLEAFAGESAELVRQQILNEFQKLDVLVHTANAAFPLTPVNLLDSEVMDKALHTLVTLPHEVTRELFPLLKLADHPSIIFTSHFSAHTHKAYWGYHAGAFAALEALSRQWAADTHNLGFSVNSVDPGAVRTAVRKKHYPAEDPSLLRAPDDEEVISLYLNLMSRGGKTRSGEHFTL